MRFIANLPIPIILQVLLFTMRQQQNIRNRLFGRCMPSSLRQFSKHSFPAHREKGVPPGNKPVNATIDDSSTTTTTTTIPRIDARKLKARDAATMKILTDSITETGFLVITNTEISRQEILQVIETYRAFFHQPTWAKRQVDMSRTKSNRGWGASQSEQVNPKANPDYKQVFDCGYELSADDPLISENLSVYAPNQWPDTPTEFKAVIQNYYTRACGVAMELLRSIAAATDLDESYFDNAFSRPTALLRGNYYPARPSWAGQDDYAIAAHTDYGCLTLLASDGTPGLEVQTRDGGSSWLPVHTMPGELVVNFGEMLESWSGGKIRATPHYVRGGTVERISVPLFFNPNHDANVAPVGSSEVVLAGEYLAKRFSETYVHLQQEMERET